MGRVRITGEKPYLTQIEIGGQIIPNVRSYTLHQEAGKIPIATIEILVAQSDIDLVGESVLKLEGATENVERELYERLKAKYGGDQDVRGSNIQADNASEVDL